MKAANDSGHVLATLQAHINTRQAFEQRAIQRQQREARARIFWGMINCALIGIALGIILGGVING
jgi:F0F1-type ATP synthase assembly protein I